MENATPELTMDDLHESTHHTPNKKRFRPLRSSVRTLMKRAAMTGEPDERLPIVRSATLDIQEDLAELLIKRLAERMGSFVRGSERTKIAVKDVAAAAAVEFGEEYADLAMKFANRAAARV